MKRAAVALLFGSYGLFGCSAPCACGAGAPQTPGATASDADGQSAAAGSPVAEPPTPAEPSSPAAPGAAPGATGSLPEIVIRHTGMHIGGGPNDEATKAPFKRAIEAHFDDFRLCYTKVAEPGRGGVIGVDLLVPAAGGKAELRDARSAVPGADFRECVLGVFRNIVFDKPSKGATVVSYSMEYSLVSAAR